MKTLDHKLDTLLLKPLFQVCLILLVGVLAYSNTFQVPFTFDDEYFLALNPIVSDLNYFLHPSLVKDVDIAYFNTFINRWVGYLTFVLNYQMHGFDVTGYHVVNLAIHLANALVTRWMVCLTLKTPVFETQPLATEVPLHRRLIPLLVGLLFVAHPIQTESVTYIYQRLTSLAALFYLLAIVLYIKARLAQVMELRLRTSSCVPYYLLSLVFVLLSMKTKENAFTLPAIIAVYELMFFDGALKKRMVQLIPFFMSMFVIPVTLLVNFGSVDQAYRMETDMARLDYLYTQFRVIVLYLRLIFFPVGLSIDHDISISHSFYAPNVLTSLILLLSLLAAAFYCFYKPGESKGHYRCVSFGILWFFICLSVESSIIPIKDVIFEHRVYLPSIGIFIALSAYLDQWTSTNGKAKASVYTLLFVAVMAAMVVTFQRNTVWSNGIKIWQDAVAKAPDKPRPYRNLGQTLLRAGLVDQALPPLRTAVKLMPDYKEALCDLGVGLAKKGLYDESIEMFNRALLCVPSDARLDKASIHGQMGISYYLKGSFVEALEHYQLSLRLNPADAALNNNVGLLYLSRRDFQNAETFFKVAIRLRPLFPNAYRNLGDLYSAKGDHIRAIEAYNKADEIGSTK